MKLKSTILSFIIICSLTASAQFKFGPALDIGFSSFSPKGDSVTLKGGIGPAFGVTAEKYMAYWFSLRGTALYSMKSLNTTRVHRNEKDKMNGQFFDLCLAGRFSNFDDDVTMLPYGIAGLGAAFNVASTGQLKHMVGCTYSSMPYVTIGAGLGFKLSFFSEMDLSLNYVKYLSPAFTIPIDLKDTKMSQFSLRVTGLF
jgi:hypothetical protein